MNAFFIFEDGTVNAERVRALEQVSARWIDTPFVAHSMIRHAGVDCVHLAAALYLSTGAVDDFRPPAYSLDAGQHNETSAVLSWLDANPRFARVKNDKLAPGDLLCFKFGRSEHHVGVLISAGVFIHAPIRRKVVYGMLTDSAYKRALSVAFRPIFPSAEVPG